ncbi:coenzyme PQQ biosynthesis enzyme PqqE [Prauserella sp. Am3]|nr:coenzyme PQQ biosynthesis enzyme PqqE [Prauserella sp. Am3]
MTGMPRPFGLLAEVTHQCPLHCVYCSNPVELFERGSELGTDDWLRVIRQSAELGVLQVHFSGGEPLVRGDLETLVAECRGLGLYTNLITSGLGLTESRAASLVEAGLNSAQLSIQGDTAESTNLVAASKRFDKKEAAARTIREAGLPLNMNVVLHRLNLDRLDAIIDVCVSWGAERLELANTQYYGWALRNRELLLPSRSQLDEAVAVYERRKAELAGRMELLWILPDYYEPYPKPCMGGWAQTALTVAPDGRAYPCPVAEEITTLDFPSVREHDLEWIWAESPAFRAYRGTDWMPDPCRSCSRKELDFGGCRCQAFALTGDAGRTDPVCIHSPDHHLVEDSLARANGSDRAGESTADPQQLVHRRPTVSARRS